MALGLTHLGDLAHDSLQVVAAEALAAQRYPHFDPSGPALVLGLADADLDSRIPDALALAYPPSRPCALLDHAGRHELSLDVFTVEADFAPGASLWIAPLPYPGEFAALLDVVARCARRTVARGIASSPGPRCALVLEEAYELLGALDADDAGKMAEELGDLLLQVALLAQIAAEEGVSACPM